MSQMVSIGQPARSPLPAVATDESGPLHQTSETFPSRTTLRMVFESGQDLHPRGLDFSDGFSASLSKTCSLRRRQGLQCGGTPTVRRFRDTGGFVGDGDRILILGEDENGKTDDFDPILIRVDQPFSHINGQNEWSMKALLLGPFPKNDDDEETLSNNHFHVILKKEH